MTLGVKRHVVKSEENDGKSITITMDVKAGKRQICGTCGTLGKVRDRLKQRIWKHASLWGIPTTIAYRPARVSCPKCQRILVEAIPWNQGKSRLSVGLIWMLADWCKQLPWGQVAQMYGLHWNTVAKAVKQAVAYGLANRKIGQVLHIGIDELSRRKGHVYVTNVYDLAENRLLWSGEGRSQETLQAFFNEFGPMLQSRIKCVCCDMWQPYIDMIKKNLPAAVLVFDRFHIVQNLLKAVDEVRRQEAVTLKQINPDLLARSRYIWLKNSENLSDSQRSRLSYLERLNLRSHRAWLLKECFREFWEYRSKPHAARFLAKWFWWATHSRLKPMRDFAWMLRRHEENILAFFDQRITNGRVEGLNNKAKVISHRSYGFRTVSTYITALYHCLGKLPQPKLVHRFV
jgi:transposase